MEFPKMIYLGGNHGAEHRIVADESEQNAAKEDGFLPVGEHFKAKETDDPPSDEKAELIAALTAAGKPFDKRWGLGKLRAAAEAKPE